MVGGHEKQSESNTTSTSSSVSALASAVSADYLIAPPLQNVTVDTQYVGINEEEKQLIRQLQEELADWFPSCVVQYSTVLLRKLFWVVSNLYF